MADEALLAKIKKLINLSASDNVNESAAAQAKVQSLLIQHKIDMAEVEGFSLEKQEKVSQSIMKGLTKRNRTAWYNRLAHIIARANLCDLLTVGSSQIWIGKPSDMEMAQFLFSSVAHDLMQICEKDWAAYKNSDPYPVHGKTWKNSFYNGACAVIQERLSSNLTQLKNSNEKMNALIVNNDIELKEYMNQTYPHTRTIKTNVSISRSGFDAGKSAARGLQFRTGVSSGGSLSTKLLRG